MARPARHPRGMRPDQPTGPRAAVVGFQGFGNVGDEAILRGIEGLIGPAVSVRTVFTGGLEPVAAFPAAERRRTFRHLPTPSAWRALRRVDALLIGGGGLVNDYWATVIPRYVAWCVVARLAGRSVVWIGAGVGPIRRRPWRWLAGLGFLASRLVLVRDEASADWVRRCWRGARVRVMPDPAFFQDVPGIDAVGSTPAAGATPATPAAAGAAPATPAAADAAPATPAADAAPATPAPVGIVARGPAPLDAEREPAFADALAGVALDLQRRAVPAQLISLHPAEDRRFFASVQAALRARGGSPLPEVWTEPDPDATMALLGRCSMLLTVRLHGLILGALMGVPSVAVTYDRKVAEAAAALGLDDLAVPLAGATAATLCDALARLEADRERPARVRAAVEAIRAQRDAVAGGIVGAVDR